MTLDQALAKLKWTRKDLADRLGITPTSISRWQDPPRYAMAYLELAIRVKEMADSI